ncbi:MAG: hypothetical protein EBR82_32610 [Caulobacteraceae bacterium]|nr:hypothetical protein [Caulobacteraceae bacterium]
MLNDKKVSFIICSNDDACLDIALVSINSLIKPEGFEFEIINIKNTKNVAAGYNSAIDNSNAKYKVYMHQDVQILKPDLILRIINIFKKNEKLGYIGICGSKDFTPDGFWWHSLADNGNIYVPSNKHYGILYDFFPNEGGLKLTKFNLPKKDSDFEEIKSIDGLMFITQYDVKWRDDLFQNYFFFDTWQAIEFYERGYIGGILNSNEDIYIYHFAGLKPWWDNPDRKKYEYESSLNYQKHFNEYMRTKKLP